MFGFQAGESIDIVSRKRDYMRDAQRRWHFLTHFDLSTVKNEAQLSSLVVDRSGIAEAQARRDVQAWMMGKRF